VSTTDQFILFALGCLAFGTLYRMALGQTFGEAAKNTFKVASAPTRAVAKTGYRGFKLWRRM